MVLRSLQTTLIGTSIRAEPLASRWTWTVAPSVMEKSCWALIWRSLCGWITAPQQSVHVCDLLLASPFLSSCRPLSFYLFLISQVFNLLTGSVSVIINGRESRFSPAQSFMVPCGENIFWIKASYCRCIANVSCWFFLIFPLCSHSTCLQHPERHGTACSFILHQDICWKFRLKMAA